MNYLNIGLILALAVVPCLFGKHKRFKEMGFSILAFCLALAFTNLDKFAKFKGGGFEAELRTQELKSAVKETYAALDQLKQLALALSNPIVEQVTVSGKLLVVAMPAKIRQVKTIEATLKKLGATDAEIKESCGEFYEILDTDHFRFVLVCLGEANSDKKEMFTDLYYWKFDGWTVETLRKLISDSNLKENDKSKEAMRDLEFFLEHRELRRPEIWQ